MRVINIIEITDNNVQGVESFAIHEEQFSKETVAVAEALFEAKAVENGARVVDLKTHVEDGYYQNGDYSVNLVWSEIN